MMRRWLALFTTRRVCVYGFFGLLLLLGLGIYPDYGISWDEDLSRATGMVSLRYVAEKIFPALVAHHQDGTYPPLSDWANRDYGVVFEMPACLLERVLRIDDLGARYRLRHLLTFLVCFGGVIAVYQLGRQRFSDWRLGLLGAAWLVLSPRLFAESFYNSKDAVFMALMAIATVTAVRLVLRPTTGRAIWHALACAAAIDVRVMGIVLPGATLGLLVVRALGGRVAWRTLGRVAGLYAVLLAVFVVAGWPYLWAAPWTNLKSAFQHMSVYYWDNTVLYRGELVRALALPWHYAPVWIGITTPVFYLVWLLVGLVAVGGSFRPVRWRLWADDDHVQDLLFALLLLGPLLAVIVLHSALYDGWRHLYFVYPALLLLALRGWALAWHWLSSRQHWRLAAPALLAVTGLSMLHLTIFIVKAHPNQQVYFNPLAGQQVATSYELDYWGLSFRQGLNYIVSHDARPRIIIQANAEVAPVARLNLCMLPAADRQRVVFTESKQAADYFITNYRWHPRPYPYPHEVHRVMAGEVRILSVFKLK
ncbi:hypothetical protein [Hymenobacter terrenus]|uniref:hypothetical protein n=1 Tax=Hymenobacter terrenus TaxID=1629124 RepID=UPI000619B619|nr:hypothetical protein [Hymenobacter terrenus]